MFSLHEITKTNLARIAFFVMCLVPTCAILLWSVVIRMPGYREGHERAISRALGVDVQVSRVSTPRPGIVLYEGLLLSEPESRQLLASLPFVEIEARGDDTGIRLPFPAKINGTRLDVFWNAVQRQLSSTGRSRKFRFEAHNVTLHLTDGDQTLSDLMAEMDNGEDQAALRLTFKPAVAGKQHPTTATLEIRRDREQNPPATSFTFSSPQLSLPCDLIASVCPTLSHFGKASAFRGQVSAVERAGQWNARVDGKLTGIDLGRLVSDQFRHKLSGTAQADISISIKQGRIENAAGKLQAGPGSISRSLIDAAQTHLNVNVSPEIVASRKNILPYGQLNLTFSIDPRALALGSGSRDSLAILFDQGGRPLVAAPATGSKLLVSNLVRMLVPQTQFQVPASRETAMLTNLLPIPSSRSEPGNEQPLESRVILKTRIR